MTALLAFIAACVLAATSGTDGFSLPDLDAFWLLRAPRLALGVLAGAGLASGGVACQALLQNPLADPYVLGLSGGAALGAVLVTLLWAPPVWVVFFAALVGAFAASMLVMTAQGGRSLQVGPLLLTGVVFNAFAAAVITLVKTIVSATQAQEILFWLMGQLLVYDFAYIAALAPCVLAGFALLIWEARGLDALVQGDNVAQTLGVDPKRLRLRVYAALTLLVGSVVALTGLIGFVGLVIPHLVRARSGPAHRPLLVRSALWGATLLLVSDALCRLGFQWFATELPVGVLTAFIGAPYFIAVLRRPAFRAAAL